MPARAHTLTYKTHCIIVNQRLMPNARHNQTDDENVFIVEQTNPTNSFFFSLHFTLSIHTKHTITIYPIQFGFHLCFTTHTSTHISFGWLFVA